ncbi:uncharacterized protein HMPREF1541_05404 [Cyphellophora europaea CBS 101466]|uniref:Protein kinase domain-containing protein n=1 Tax=Cyphellophora europaea (strain CBS 101466) TaxID=1220924 RepID=W2RRM6_CYPE1|nr:uncharacterized protein HMPREF1541_05404 [Cyphellophora europaea CBS 101466]ETN39181.1 hypothetical protein HMPREF1541_05404 [Cyphellophora europaea CBS 101466]
MNPDLQLSNEIGTPVANADTASASKEGLVFSNAIDCNVVACLHPHPMQRSKPETVLWQDESSFGRLTTLAETLLERHHVPAGSKLYLQYGSAHILLDKPDKPEVDVRPLDDKADWSGEVQTMIAKALVRKKETRGQESFILETRWTHGILHGLDSDTDNPRNKIRGVLNASLVRTQDDVQGRQQYIPRRVLDTVFNEQRIRQLVSNDESINPSMFGTRDALWQNELEFARDIYLNGVRLLALFVYVTDIKLSFLHYILERAKQRGFENTPLVHRFLNVDDLPHDCPQFELDRMLEQQFKFNAHEFTSVSQMEQPMRIDLDFDTIVPITHVVQDGKPALVGKGNYGRVYRVRIEPGHHRFDADQSKCYALKVSKRDLEVSEEALEHEEQVFRKLIKASKSSQYLVLYRAIWTHKRRLYMLFDLAEGSLKELLSSARSPMSNSSAVTLLALLRGVAKGVQHIHRSTRLKESNESPAPDHLPKPKINPPWTGYHHDLKPANILRFKDDRGKEVWKISDFGTARLTRAAYSGSGANEYNSGGTGAIRGDSVYRSPDYELNATSSRPSDIWSLACIFLEALLWAFNLAVLDESDESFEWKRTKNRGAKGGESQTTSSATFWYSYYDEEGHAMIELKPVVREYLNLLQQHCEHWGVFADLVRILNRMFNIPSKIRPKAPEIVDYLKRLQTQAQADIDAGADYSKPLGTTPKAERVTDLRGGSVLGGEEYNHGPVPVRRHIRRNTISNAQLQRSHITDFDAANLHTTGSHYASSLLTDSARPTPQTPPRLVQQSMEQRFAATVTAPDGTQSHISQTASGGDGAADPLEMVAVRGPGAWDGFQANGHGQTESEINGYRRSEETQR